jgi:hypothetical protein
MLSKKAAISIKTSSLITCIPHDVPCFKEKEAKINVFFKISNFEIKKQSDQRQKCRDRTLRRHFFHKTIGKKIPFFSSNSQNPTKGGFIETIIACFFVQIIIIITIIEQLQPSVKEKKKRQRKK